MTHVHDKIIEYNRVDTIGFWVTSQTRRILVAGMKPCRFTGEFIGGRTNISLSWEVTVLILVVIGKTYITGPPHCYRLQ